MSRMDLTPAETRPTGHLVSSCRSAETSMPEISKFIDGIAENNGSYYSRHRDAHLQVYEIE